MIHTPELMRWFATSNELKSVLTSALKLAMFVPVAVVGVIEFVMLAGDTLVTAATEGSTNCLSRNCTKPAARSSRTTVSAAGLENLTSSSVNTLIAAAFAHVNEIESKVIDVSGFGAASPTHPLVVPPVARGILTLNGTRRKPGMRPMIVSGRKNSANALVRFCA